MKNIFILLLITTTLIANAARIIDADQIRSSDRGSTWTPPPATDNLVGTAASQTLTNKTMSGSSNTFTNISAATALTGVLPVANGGTGQSSYTDGQLLIGNSTGNTLTKASLTAGSGITITPGSGSVTIAATGASVGKSGFKVITSNGCGATATARRDYSTTLESAGSDITLTIGNANTATFATINTAGKYCFTANEAAASGPAVQHFAIAVDDSGTTSPTALSYANGRRAFGGVDTSSLEGSITFCDYLGVNSTVSVIVGTCGSNTQSYGFFSGERVE